MHESLLILSPSRKRRPKSMFVSPYFYVHSVSMRYCNVIILG